MNSDCVMMLIQSGEIMSRGKMSTKPKYRVVVYSTLNGYNMTTVSEPLHYVSSAENLLEDMLNSGNYTGGRIEELIFLLGNRPKWMTYT